MLALLLGCAEPIPLSDIQVADADLDGVSLTGVAVVGGGHWGNATLRVVDTDDQVHLFPVRLSGGEIGALLEVEHSVDFSEFDVLELPDEALTADQLLGRYSGTSATFAVVAGASGHNLENRHGVQFDRTFLTFGIGVYGGLETLYLRLGDEYGEDWDYAWQQGSWDTNAPADDTADTPDTGDTGATDSDPPTDTNPVFEPPETDPPQSQGCGGDGGDPTGCLCSSSLFAPAGWLGVLAFAALRRRVRPA